MKEALCVIDSVTRSLKLTNVVGVLSKSGLSNAELPGQNVGRQLLDALVDVHHGSVENLDSRADIAEVAPFFGTMTAAIK